MPEIPMAVRLLFMRRSRVMRTAKGLPVIIPLQVEPVIPSIFGEPNE